MDNAPLEELPTRARQEIDALPPGADDNGVRYALAEREPLAQSPKAKLTEGDPSVGVVKKYSVATKMMPKVEDASTKESAPDAVAPLATSNVYEMLVEHSLFASSHVAVICGVGCNPPSLFGIVDCPLQAYVTVTMMAVEVDGRL